MKKMLSVFIALNLALSVSTKINAADAKPQDGDSKSQGSSDDSSEYSSDTASNDSSNSPGEKIKVEIRPGADVEAKGTMGVNAGGGTVKVAPKGVAVVKFEPYIAVGGSAFDVKIKAGGTLSGQATTADVKTDDHRDKSDASAGVHGALAVETKKSYFRVEGKGGHVWTAESGQYNFLQAVIGGCSSPGEKNEKFQLCVNGFLTRSFYEQYKATEVGGELFIQKRTDGGTKIFGGPRYAFEKTDSNGPETHFIGLTFGVTSDLNAGAISKSK